MSAERVEEGRRVVEAAAAQNIALRLLGGVGVVLHCPAMLADGPHRPIGDIDVAVAGAEAKALAPVLAELRYEPEARFNLMHGDRRLIFQGPQGKLDVFVGAFEMCHRIELAPRLRLDAETLTASDLLLTKLQIVELNAKDAHDAQMLLREHPLGEGPGDHVDVPYIAALAAEDWGLWRTATRTLGRLAALAPDVAPAADVLGAALDEVPKSRRFRLRARVGDRRRWYQLPDDVE